VSDGAVSNRLSTASIKVLLHEHWNCVARCRSEMKRHQLEKFISLSRDTISVLCVNFAIRPKKIGEFLTQIGRMAKSVDFGCFCKPGLNLLFFCRR
jgi:hypothetical protein